MTHQCRIALRHVHERDNSYNGAALDFDLAGWDAQSPSLGSFGMIVAM
jgi:hypothetical protein